MKDQINKYGSESGYLNTEGTYGATLGRNSGSNSPGKIKKKARFADDNDVIISSKKGGLPSKRRITGKKLSPSSLKQKAFSIGPSAYSEVLSQDSSAVMRNETPNYLKKPGPRRVGDHMVQYDRKPNKVDNVYLYDIKTKDPIIQRHYIEFAQRNLRLYKYLFNYYASKSTAKTKPIIGTFDTIAEQGKYINNQEVFRFLSDYNIQKTEFKNRN